MGGSPTWGFSTNILLQLFLYTCLQRQWSCLTDKPKDYERWVPLYCPASFWQKDDCAFCVCPLIFSISSTILFDFYDKYYFSGLHDKVSVWDKQKGVFSQYYFLLHFVIGLSGSCFLATLFPVEKPQDSFDTI